MRLLHVLIFESQGEVHCMQMLKEYFGGVLIAPEQQSTALNLAGPRHPARGPSASNSLARTIDLVVVEGLSCRASLPASARKRCGASRGVTSE